MKAFLFFTFLSLRAFAQDACAPDVTSRRAVVEHEGIEGIWFPTPVARCILSDLIYARAAKKELEAKDAKLSILADIARAAKEETKLENEKSELLQTTNAALAKKIEQMRPAWYENPLLAVSLGLVAGLIGGIVIMVAAK